MSRYFQAEQNRFGGLDSDQARLSNNNNNIIRYARMERFNHAIAANTAPKIGRDNVSRADLADLTTLWYGVQIMKARPEFFPGSKVDRRPYQIEVHGTHVAWKLLSCLYNDLTTRMGLLTVNHKSDPRKKAPKTDPAFLDGGIDDRPPRTATTPRAPTSPGTPKQQAEVGSGYDPDNLQRRLKQFTANEPAIWNACEFARRGIGRKRLILCSCWSRSYDEHH